ncbi:sensor histidine kinase [Neobacillus cucumis]|uniref:sensor histidine kinase n=1 Tax=Neobacillus cucumis TaxID=1740721 RepID=UPI0019623745|nr:sensor histidine kinase [Neobacillus cucumis]MBM7650914.1 signal transduction histidine kinase [Neobacillus cucumis]
MLNSKSGKMLWAFKTVLILSIFYDIVTRDGLSVEMKAAWITGILLMQANDFFRTRYRLWNRNRLLYTVSMLVNIALIGIYMVMFDNAATSVYYVFPLAEIFLSGGSIPKGIVSIHVLVYLAGMIAAKADVQTSLISYIAIFMLVYLFRAVSLEREKGQLLNAELVEAHAKLKEITIVKERTRIAQEMHDSIGHSLIALRMHLEFAENMMEVNSQKAGESIAKAHEFSRKSINELRKAVAILKDQSVSSQIELGELLNDMIESLETSGKLKFTLNFDEEVETSSQDMKNCIYNSVREAVTNGLKHGKAQQFLVDITKSGEKIRVAVEDNGEGCGQIKKSNGLQGIEDRIGLLNGTVSFYSEKGRGFKMLAEIPA